jgi:hypothetical protein
MPSDNGAGVRILMGKRKITTEDWIELIKFRVALIKPFLDKITLSGLGYTTEGIHWLGANCLYNLHRPDIHDAQLWLKTQGFFKLIDRAERGDSRRFTFLGLSREGRLMDIQIRFERQGNDYAIYKLTVDYPEITVNWFDEYVWRPKPRSLFSYLGVFFEEATKEKEDLYKKMEEVYKIMEFEKNLLPFVSG